MNLYTGQFIQLISKNDLSINWIPGTDRLVDSLKRCKLNLYRVLEKEHLHF